MDLGDFKDTGCFVKRTGPTKITRFQVLGERSSGTNYLKRLLGRNTSLRPTEDLGWKHGFVQTMAIPPDFAVIGVVRRADDWARSMHARPWHSQLDLRCLEFSEFLRSPWDSFIDRGRFFPGLSEWGADLQCLQQDRHPLTGQAFSNILEMRRVKLSGLLSYLERRCTFVLVRCENAIHSPKQVLNHIAHHLDLEEIKSVKPVHKRQGFRFKSFVDARPDTPDTLSHKDTIFLRSQLDIKSEKNLGYEY